MDADTLVSQIILYSFIGAIVIYTIISIVRAFKLRSYRKRKTRILSDILTELRSHK